MAEENSEWLNKSMLMQTMHESDEVGRPDEVDESMLFIEWLERVFHPERSIKIPHENKTR